MLSHHQPSGVLVLFSKLSIQRDFIIKSCSLIFLFFTSLPQMIDSPLSLMYIHSNFPALISIRGLLTVPLALPSCQAVKEESAAASSTIEFTHVCGQQSQPPSWGCDRDFWTGEAFVAAPILPGQVWIMPCVPSPSHCAPAQLAAPSPLGEAARDVSQQQALKLC